MNDAIAALVGAIVGLAGAGLLQAARFSREDVAAGRQRLGAARLLRAELLQAKTQLDVLGQEGQRALLSTHFRFPLEAWRTSGRTVIADLSEPDGAVLVEAFGRVAMTNDVLIGLPDVVPYVPAQMADAFRFAGKKVDAAIDLLRRVIERYERDVVARERPVWRRLARAPQGPAS